MQLKFFFIILVCIAFIKMNTGVMFFKLSYMQNLQSHIISKKKGGLVELALNIDKLLI